MATRRRKSPEQIVRLLGQADAMLANGAKRAAAGHLIATMGVSTRFACRVVGLERSTYAAPHPDQTPHDPDAGLRTWLCAYAKKHPRWGYRRAHHDARAEGSSTAAGQVTAHGPDDVSGIDFQFDRVEDGQALKVCSIVDEHTRESLGGLTGTSITGDRAIALSFIPPGTPWNNGYVESFHVRRHSSLNYKTPIEYARDCTHRR